MKLGHQSGANGHRVAVEDVSEILGGAAIAGKACGSV
jgi:hypothetical protein